jgi:hypothetical protein
MLEMFASHASVFAAADASSPLDCLILCEIAAQMEGFRVGFAAGAAAEAGIKTHRFDHCDSKAVCGLP